MVCSRESKKSDVRPRDDGIKACLLFGRVLRFLYLAGWVLFFPLSEGFPMAGWSLLCSHTVGSARLAVSSILGISVCTPVVRAQVRWYEMVGSSVKGQVPR